MDDTTPPERPQRVGPVEPDLLASALFVFSEYRQRLAAEGVADEDEDEAPAIDTRAVLDLLAEELGTEVGTTLNLFMRLTALDQLLSSSPALARRAVDPDNPAALREDALVAAARLDLYVERRGRDGVAAFDPREFSVAIDAA